MNGELIRLLKKRAGSDQRAEEAVAQVQSHLGIDSLVGVEETVAAVALCAMGERPERVSGMLSWSEFERFVSLLLTGWGYQARWNLTLRKPRAQIDLLASGRSLLLSVDCKHWQRGLSPSSSERLAQSQLRRSGLLRRQLDDPRPIASVILTFADAEGTFVEGVAIVPVRALRSFLESVESYSSSLVLK